MAFTYVRVDLIFLTTNNMGLLFFLTVHLKKFPHIWRSKAVEAKRQIIEKQLAAEASKGLEENEKLTLEEQTPP